MRIVVTGLSGNLGTALLRRLATTHQHEVVGIVRRPPSGGEPYEAASWVALDLADGSAESGLRRAFTGADAVVHLAWEFQPSHDVDYMDRGTVGGTAAVLSAADAAGVAHLVHLSSLGVYSPAPRAVSDGTPARVDEDYPRDGISSLSYSREKVAAERLLDDYEAVPATGHRVAITRIRPGIVMQRDAASAILRYTTPPWLPSRVLRHVPVLPLDRSLTFPGVHADDVAAALVVVLEQRATGAFTWPPSRRSPPRTWPRRWAPGSCTCRCHWCAAQRR
ncbi:MAG: NAD-dependent epimerase/dehydratase family protein [Nocardioidaceae bacterium]